MYQNGSRRTGGPSQHNSYFWVWMVGKACCKGKNVNFYLRIFTNNFLQTMTPRRWVDMLKKWLHFYYYLIDH